MLVGTGLMLRSFAKLTGIPLGIAARNVLTVPLELPRQKYNDVSTAAEPGQRDVDQQLCAALGGDMFPVCLAGDLVDQLQSAADTAERFLDGLLLVGVRIAARGRVRSRSQAAAQAGHGVPRRGHAGRSCGPVPVYAAGQELLSQGRVAEDVEDARGGSVWLDAESVLDPGCQLCLLVELLEGAGPGDQPVA